MGDATKICGGHQISAIARRNARCLKEKKYTQSSKTDQKGRHAHHYIILHLTEDDGRDAALLDAEVAVCPTRALGLAVGDGSPTTLVVNRIGVLLKCFGLRLEACRHHL